MFKRIDFVIVVCLLLLLSSAAIFAGGNKEEMKSDDNFSIVYVQGMSGIPFFNSLTNGAKAEAAKLGMTFSYQGGNSYSPETQTPILNAVIASKPDAIIINPMAGEAMKVPLTEAKKAGIVVVFADTAASDLDLAVSFIASDNYAGGKFAADNLAKLIGEKGKVMVQGGTAGISTTDQRTQGFEDQIKNYPNIEFIGTQYCGSDPAKATSIISATLAAHPYLKGIYTVSTQELEGAAVALVNADAKDKVALVGFDSSPIVIEHINSGVIKGTVLQEPYEMGVIAVQQAYNALTGKAVTAKIDTPFVFLTLETMKDPEISKYIYQDEIE